MPTESAGTQPGLESAEPSAGRPGAPPPIFLDGEVVAERFEIRRFLGQGGMGQVFEAYDRELRTEVAVKVVRPDRRNLYDLESRFRAEVEIARRVTHRNVCRVFDLFPVTTSDETWGRSGNQVMLLTMELVPGETLAATIRRRGPKTLAEALSWIEQMASALDAAHSAGVAHRDFKTSNVVLRPSDGHLEAVVTDFGLARSTGSEGSNPGFEGTLEYAAPEVRNGAEGNARSDIYSFGAVLHELFTGEPPPRVRGGAKSLALPGRLPQVISRCLEARPEARYPTAGAAVEALARPRNAWRRALGATVAFAIVAFGILASQRTGRPEGTTTAAQDTTQDPRWQRAVEIYHTAQLGPGDALDYSVRSVEALAEAGDTSGALRQIEALRTRPPGDSDGSLALDLLDAEVSERAGRYSRQLEAARRALVAAEASAHPLLAARAQLFEASALHRLGQAENAAAATKRALAALAEEGDEWSRARAALRFDLSFLESRGLLDSSKALEALRALGDREGEARLLVARARTELDGHENPSELMSTAEMALNLARDVESFRAESEALNLIALVRWTGGDEAGAIAGFRQARRAAEASGDQRLIAGYSMNLALLLQHYGDSPEIRDNLLSAVSIFRDLGSRGDLSRALANLARYQRNRRNYADAERIARQALAEAEAFDDPRMIHNSWELLTLILVPMERFDEAQAAATNALALAQTDEEREWDRLRLARIQWKGGDPEEAEPVVFAITQRNPLDAADASLAISSRLDLARIREALDRPAAAARVLEETLPRILDSGSRGKRRSAATQAARLHRLLDRATRFPEILEDSMVQAEREERLDDLALIALEQVQFQRRLGEMEAACTTLHATIRKTKGHVEPQLLVRLETQRDDSAANCQPVEPAPTHNSRS